MTFPTDLTDLNQWICWQYTDDDPPRKIPKRITGLEARANDPETWSSFDDAESNAAFFSGVAFVFSEDDPFTGIDLDNCIDEDGGLRDWVWPIISRFDGLAYAEVSPSGTGIKLITRAKKPENASCVHQFGGSKQQLECYDNRRYWCMTGDVYNRNTTIGDGQAAVDWLCENYLTPQQPQQKKTAATPPRLITAGGSSAPIDHLRRRAEAYLQSVPWPAEGDRNNTCFSVGGNLAAIDHNGLRLPEADVVLMVKDWAAVCDPTFPPEEVEQAVRSSFVNGTAREPKLYEERQPAQVVASEWEEPVPEDENAESDSPDIPGKLYTKMPGLMGEVFSYINESSIYYLPEAFLASTLSLMSVLTGRKIQGLKGMRTNLFCITAAPTGSGKDYGRKCIEKILMEADSLDFLGPEGFTAGSAIISELEHHPAKLFQLDEFGQTLRAIRSVSATSHVRAISDTLLKLYTSASGVFRPTGYSDRSRNKAIVQPHVVINATTTPEALWQAMSRESVAEGLLGRFTLFEGSYQHIGEIDLKDVAIPESVIKRVQWWRDYSPTRGNVENRHPQPTRLDFIEDAEERLRGHMTQCANKRLREDSIRAAVWSRVAERSQKLALMHAASRGSMSVTLEDVDWGIALSNAIARKTCYRFTMGASDNEQEATKKKILAIIAENGPLTKREVTRKTQFVTKRERDAILEDLVDGGFIFQFSASKRGQNVTQFRAR